MRVTNELESKTCSNWKVNVICLHESKLELIIRDVMHGLWGCQHMDWCHSTSRGASGGILLMWVRRVAEKIASITIRITPTCPKTQENIFNILSPTRIGVIQLLKGLLVESCLHGLGGW
jgi:hypothetical protein